MPHVQIESKSAVRVPDLGLVEHGEIVNVPSDVAVKLVAEGLGKPVEKPKPTREPGPYRPPFTR